MNEQPEPRSPFKENSIWNAARAKVSKRHWSFKTAKTRGKLPELPEKIKKVGFNTGIFQFGPYRGTIEEIKEFAKIKGIDCLTNGAIKYKVA
jgi:hypothetical protein